MAKYLVTGGHGFIGSNITKTLLENDHDVYIIDDFSSGREVSTFPINRDVPTLRRSLGSANANETVELINDFEPDYILHLAAIPRVLYSVEHPIETTIANVMGLLEILEAAQKARTKVKRVVFSSSSSVYGDSQKLPTTIGEGGKQPQLSPYALQKWHNEQWCRMYSKLYNLDTACLRYFNVFGPGQYGDSAYATTVSAFTTCFCQGTSPHIDGDGEQSRDIVFIDDVVQANILAAEYPQPLSAKPFNIASGHSFTVNTIFEKVAKEYFKQTKQTIPDNILDIAEKKPPRKGDVRDTLANISETKEILGWQPKVCFEQGLEETIKWNMTQWNSNNQE